MLLVANNGAHREQTFPSLSLFFSFDDDDDDESLSSLEYGSVRLFQQLALPEKTETKKKKTTTTTKESNEGRATKNANYVHVSSSDR